MANFNIVIPTNFSQQLNQFMVNVQKMQQLTQKFAYTSQHLQAGQNLYLSHRAVTSRVSQLLLAMRKINSRLQGVISTMINSVGALGRNFIRGLSLASEVLGPIISAMFTIGGLAVSFTIKAFSWGTFLAKWLWDKFVGLGDSILQDHLVATGAFATIGGIRAFRIATAGLPDDPNILPGMVQARGNVTSLQLIALKTLRINASHNTADMMMQATIAAARFMRQQAKGLQLRTAAIFGITSLISPERLVALENLNEEELRELEQAYERYKPLMEITSKARTGWINFTLQVQATGAQIISIVANELANPKSPFVQALTELSKSIGRFFKVIMETPAIKEFINRLGKYIDEFADWLTKPENIQEIKKLIRTIGEIVKSTIEAISLLKEIVKDWTDPQRGPHLRGRRALARQIGIERPPSAPPIVPGRPIARYPGREAFTRKIGVARPPSAPPIAPEIPIKRYPGRERFTEKIGIARPPSAERIAPKEGVRTSPSATRPASTGVRTSPSATRPASTGVRPSPTGAMPAPTPGGPAPDKIGVSKGTVNQTDLYNTYVQYFKNSKLNGYVPKDGARWGITKGTPEEYARLAMATSKQESSLNPRINANGLNQMSATDLRRYSVTGDPLDPNNQAQGLVNQWEKHIRQDEVFSQPMPNISGGHGGAGRFFESVQIKRGGSAQMEKYLPREAPTAQSSSTAQPPAGATSPDAVKAVGGKEPEAFIMHHTGGGGTAEGVQNTLRQRGLGVQYVMERDGTIKQIGGPGSAHMMPESRYRQSPILGKDRPFLQNSNVVGMEVIAKNDKDVTPAQVAAARKFIAERYPNTPVYGHGEVNPGHKEADEGMTITGAIRSDRATPSKPQVPYSQSYFQSQLKIGEHEFPLGRPQPSEQDRPHPIKTVKIDNRSDHDISEAKSSSDNDVGSSQPAEDVTRFVGHQEEMDKQFSKPSVAKPFEYGVDMPSRRFRHWRKSEDIEDRRERTPNIRYSLGNRKGGDPEIDPLPSKMGAELGMADVLREEQKKATGSESSKMYLQRQIDTYEKLKRGEKVEEEEVAPPSAEELQ
jgi:hypothetical protein